MKNLKKRLKKGDTLIGSWLNLGSALTAEMVGSAGFDWLLIDLEHGSGTEKDVRHQLQALGGSSAASIVRVESFERQRIHRVLDFGAEGIMCPRINNAREANKVARGLRYPPEGSRGVARMVRATDFGQNFSAYYQGSKENIVGIVQIETAEVLDHLAEIAELDGIDVLFIGPSDLSMQLGIYGEFDHPLFTDALQKTIDAAKRAGKATGILMSDPDDFITYREMGIQMIACGSDATYVAKGARTMAKKLKKHRDNYNK